MRGRLKPVVYAVMLVAAAANLAGQGLRQNAKESQEIEGAPPAPEVEQACGIVMSDRAVGSGFWIASNTFVTCFHVVGEALPKMSIQTSSGKIFTPTGVRAFSAKNDVAILEVQPAHERVLKTTINPRLGSRVTSIGNSEGKEVLRADSGKVTGLGPRFIEVDAQIRGGCSGGPLLDDDGSVIGISSFMTFRPLAVVDGEVVLDKSMQNARKFGIRSEVLLQCLESATNGLVHPLKVITEPYAESKCIPYFLFLDEFIAKDLFNGLSTQLKFRNVYERSGGGTKITSVPVETRGNYIAIRPDRAFQIEQTPESIVDHHIIEGGSPAMLTRLKVTASVIIKVLDFDEVKVAKSATVTPLKQNLATLAEWLPKYADSCLSLQNCKFRDFGPEEDKAQKLRVSLIQVQRAYAQQIASLRAKAKDYGRE